MWQLKQKQQPFFVKRIRLRKELIRTNEILEMISNYDHESSKYTTISDSFAQEEQQLKLNFKRLSLTKSDSFYPEEQRHHSGRPDKLNLKNIVKIYKHRNSQRVATQMNKIGIEVRRIVGDPKHKRSYQYSPHTIDPEKGRQRQSSYNKTYSHNFPSNERNINDECDKVIIELKSSQKNLQKYCTITSSIKKNRVYLYQKMAKTQQDNHIEENQIYENRIKSYTEFLWKCMLAHNVYINLDLNIPNSSYKKLKAFIGYGNNCNMIKGLIKRRFWWSISEVLTDDCLFVWTQIKINRIYERQERASFNQSVYRYENKITCNYTDQRVTQSSNLENRSNQVAKDRGKHQSFDEKYRWNIKIWNKEDFRIFRQFNKKRCLKVEQTNRQGGFSRDKKYRQKTEEANKRCKEIKYIQNMSKLDSNQESHNYYLVKPIVHNHLEHNYLLGNKKALFYSLRQYYQKIGKDVFSIVPLTFHIKHGFKDPQYLKFKIYYEKRARMIKEENNRGHNKTRNIWIVKPGQNSNQGKGITVIDELYQFDQIIKQSMPKKNQRRKGTQDNKFEEAKTFIVQMYIDRPFLYNDRKFDIRHYMLITNIYGVTRAYWYQEGYIRTSSYMFNINNFQPQIHLTNDAIQKTYTEYGRYQPYNKISYSEYQNYLNGISERKYNFKEQILTRMKEMAKDAARSVYTEISPHNLMHNFEIFGLDFMIDRNFRPWLIEINTNPCLDCTCPLLDRIIPYMVQQGLKLSLDIIYPPPSHYPNTNKHYTPMVHLQNFKYELIFDSLSEGEQLRNLYQTSSGNISKEIGRIEQDEEFKDNGKEIKLQDFT